MPSQNSHEENALRIYDIIYPSLDITGSGRVKYANMKPVETAASEVRSHAERVSGIAGDTTNNLLEIHRFYLSQASELLREFSDQLEATQEGEFNMDILFRTYRESEDKKRKREMEIQRGEYHIRRFIRQGKARQVADEPPTVTLKSGQEVRVTVESGAFQLFYARVLGIPSIHFTGETKEGALTGIGKRLEDYIGAMRNLFEGDQEAKKNRNTLPSCSEDHLLLKSGQKVDVLVYCHPTGWYEVRVLTGTGFDSIQPTREEALKETKERIETYFDEMRRLL